MHFQSSIFWPLNKNGNERVIGSADCRRIMAKGHLRISDLARQMLKKIQFFDWFMVYDLKEFKVFEALDFDTLFELLVSV